MFHELSNIAKSIARFLCSGFSVSFAVSAGIDDVLYYIELMLAAVSQGRERDRHDHS